MQRSTTAKHDVYRNLHTRTWSVKDRATNLVIGHPAEIEAHDVLFAVNLNGLKRVRQEKRKNVHAAVRGWVVHTPEEARHQPPAFPGPEWVAVTYNPYLYTSFVRIADNSPIRHARAVRMTADMQVWAWE